MMDFCRGVRPLLKVNPLKVVKNFTALKKRGWKNFLVGPQSFYSHHNTNMDYIKGRGNKWKVRAVRAHRRGRSAGREGGTIATPKPQQWRA
jgi:hypothetical protein